MQMGDSLHGFVTRLPYRSVVGMGWAGHVWHAIDWWIEAESAWDRLCCELPCGR